MLPISELRLSIPYGIISTELTVFNVVVLSIIGNISIGLLIIYLIGPIMNLLKYNRFFKYIIEYIFSKTRTRGKIVYRLKFLGLLLFVSIPLPLTGVWTGSLASYLFGLSKKHSIVAISLGVFISSSIVTTITLIAKEVL
jgi:uncharacterized membrane protein